jgi:tetratricopeptide (TPR) repeat protein
LPRSLRLALSLVLGAVACAAAKPPPPAAAAREPASARAIALYLKARLAAAEGDRRGALDALRLALVHDPTSAQLRVSYADALARAGRLDAAQAEAERALELAPGGGAAAVDGHVVLGKVLAQSHRAEPALRAFEEAVRLEAERARRAPEEEREVDPEPWRLLARARFEAGDAAGAASACEALAAFDRAEAAAGLRELARRMLEAKNAAGAEGRLRRAVELAPADPDGWKALARFEEGRRRDAAAREAWEAALRADPDDPEALLAAAQLALRGGDVPGARGWLKQLVLASPDETSARLRATAAWLDATRPEDALEASAGPDDDRLVYMRGVALSELRRWGDAADAFGRVRPDAGEVYTLAREALGEALLRGGRTAEALRALEAAVAESPRQPGLLFALGMAYDHAGKRELALTRMRALLELKPDHAEALNYVGYSWAERGERLPEARRLVERALSLEPENGAYLDSLGFIALRQGEVDAAVGLLERAAALLPRDATVLEHLGDAYRAARRADDAARVYRQALAAGDGGEALAPARRKALERKLEGAGQRPATSRR